MNSQPPPAPPPFNDALYRALNPLQQTVSDQAKLDAVLKKYGRQMPKAAPPSVPVQWEGDNHA